MAQMWVDVQRGGGENHMALCKQRVMHGISPSRNKKTGMDIVVEM